MPYVVDKNAPLFQRGNNNRCRAGTACGEVRNGGQSELVHSLRSIGPIVCSELQVLRALMGYLVCYMLGSQLEGSCRDAQHKRGKIRAKFSITHRYIHISRENNQPNVMRTWWPFSHRWVCRACGLYTRLIDEPVKRYSLSTCLFIQFCALPNIARARRLGFLIICVQMIVILYMKPRNNNEDVIIGPWELFKQAGTLKKNPKRSETRDET